MQFHQFARSVIGICGGATLLSACGSQTGTTPAFSGKPANAVRNQAARSWMDRRASHGDLIYISSEDRGSVYVYTYPRGRLVGILTGFITPLGECTDSAGDVFVVASANASSSSSTIYEYAHGGSTPIATLNDPNPGIGCSVDPVTGNLAVSGEGVAIYEHATGNPTLYSSSQYVIFRSCGYDNQGNLYLSTDSNIYANQALLIRLPRGSLDFEQISLNVKLFWAIQWPSIQWRGRYLTVTSNPFRQPITVYRLRISGGAAGVVGMTTLNTKKNYYSGQTWIETKRIIGMGLYKHGYQNAFFWPYPKGGKSSGGIKYVGNVQQTLWGVTVSVAQLR